jgi:small-conductance mechanosensitive channel
LTVAKFYRRRSTVDAVVLLFAVVFGLSWSSVIYLSGVGAAAFTLISLFLVPVIIRFLLKRRRVLVSSIVNSMIVLVPIGANRLVSQNANDRLLPLTLGELGFVALLVMVGLGTARLADVKWS